MGQSECRILDNQHSNASRDIRKDHHDFNRYATNPVRAEVRFLGGRDHLKPHILKTGNLLRQTPSPSGRGWREAPGEGEHAKYFVVITHPALRATFSRREKDSLHSVWRRFG